MKALKLSIIIPAYQEAGRIERSINELSAYLHHHELKDSEVLVVVADSPDGTLELVEKLAVKHQWLRLVPAGPKVGKGYQVRIGMMEAKGDCKLFMDADLATPLHYIENVLKLMIDEKADVVIAVRDLSDSHKGWRKLISSVGNRLVRTVLLPGIKDTQCGFKAFSPKAADELFGRQTIVGWGFDMEILAIARKLGYEIHQVPVPDWHDAPEGSFEEAAITGAAAQTLVELGVILWHRWTGGYRQKHFKYEPYEHL